MVAPVRKPQLAPRPPSRVGGGGIRSPSTVTVERIKLLANYFNTIAAGLLTAGMIGPMAAYLYGFSTSARPYIEIFEAVVILFLTSILLHVAARSVLGRLES